MVNGPAKTPPQIIWLHGHWLCDVWSGIVVERKLGPFCWQCNTKCICIFSTSHRFCSAPLLRCNSFHWDLESYSGSDQQQTTSSDHDPLFWCKSGFGKWFGASSLSNYLAGGTGCCIKSTFHHMSQSDWEMVHCCCIELREYDTSKWFFFILVSSWNYSLIELFAPIYFKCQMATEWLVLRSLATSR